MFFLLYITNRAESDTHHPKNNMALIDSSANLVRLAQQACVEAREFAYAVQTDDHWYGELLSNATITAEQIFFYQSLGRAPIPDGEAYKTYLLNIQNKDGSWSLAPHDPGDLSTTCEAYLALKILGKSLKSGEMQRAQQFILRAGGVAKVRMFTRIYFAQFGLFPWSAVPELPAEFILMSDSGWISIYRLSSWARSTIIPLMIISHHRPVYALPNGKNEKNDYLDELWTDPTRKCVPYGPSLFRPWESDLFSLLFSAIDNGLHLLGGLRRLPLRSYARGRCVKWILDRQEQQGDWAGIIPPMHSGVQALLLEGYKLDDTAVKRGIEAIERFTWQDAQGKRLQSCVSPVSWSIAFIACSTDFLGMGHDPHDPRNLRLWRRER
jgi:squalene-hopene/tetraprenyl-beta-curcumene cyclase